MDQIRERYSIPSKTIEDSSEDLITRQQHGSTLNKVRTNKFVIGSKKRR
jgi:hypothetical protein